MLVQSVMLANHAHVAPDGLLYISGAGWEHITVQALPAPVAGYVVGIVEFGVDELNAPHLLQMLVVDADGREMGSRASITVLSQRKLAPFAIPLAVIVVSAGGFSVVISDEQNGPLGQVDCEVRMPPPSPGT